jgi:hypothetical protein
MKDNKLIAEFMGTVYPELDNAIVIDNLIVKEDELQYHNSWDWLMPVVDKIESMKANFNIYSHWNDEKNETFHEVVVTIEKGIISKDRRKVYDYDRIEKSSSDKKKAIYKAVAKFIKKLKTKT